MKPADFLRELAAAFDSTSREFSELHRISGFIEGQEEGARLARAAAWDEGYRTGYDDGFADAKNHTRKISDKNPHRKQSK